jgi:hypothetical protein
VVYKSNSGLTSSIIKAILMRRAYIFQEPILVKCNKGVIYSKYRIIVVIGGRFKWDKLKMRKIKKTLIKN